MKAQEGDDLDRAWAEIFHLKHGHVFLQFLKEDKLDLMLEQPYILLELECDHMSEVHKDQVGSYTG